MQSYEGQRFEIENWCRGRDISIDRWVNETVSGTRDSRRRELGKTLREMKKGDLLVCTELSRLGRNMMMVMSILNQCSQQEIRVYTIKDRFELSDNLNAKIIAFAFSLAAEIERNLISQRTREALAAKKQAGVRLGRPRGASKKKEKFLQNLPDVRRQLQDGVPLGAIAKKLNIHRNTLSRYLKEVLIGTESDG
jgi:DNA invertase Pin-like site-specific DNA recombinase